MWQFCLKIGRGLNSDHGITASEYSTFNICRNLLFPVGKPATLDEIKDKFCAAGNACQESIDQQVYNAKCTKTTCG